MGRSANWQLLGTGDLQWFPLLSGLFFASGSVKVVQSLHDHKLP